MPVPQVEPGSTLYAYWNGGPRVPIATDLFAFLDLQKAILATDQKGIEELEQAGRLFAVPIGTPVKVLEYHDGTVSKVPACEVRVLEGKRQDQKGWTVVTWLRGRVAIPDKAKRKRR
jgi:hypothetical protein